MKGYIDSIEKFLSMENEHIIKKLCDQYQDASTSQIDSWKTLINDVKESKMINNLDPSVNIIFEYELPNAGMALDLAFAGYDKNNKKHIYLVESKQWNDNYIENHNFSTKREDSLDLHPQNQVQKYKLSFKSYLNCGSNYEISTFVFIRNCSDLGLEKLMQKNPNNVNKSIKMYNDIDSILSLISTNLTYSNNEMKNELESSYFLPSIEIMNAMHSIISKEKPFILTQSQEDAVEEIKEAIKNGKKVIRIRGAAGTGKTAILLNLYVEYLDKLYSEKNVKTSMVVRPVFIPGNQNANMYKDIYSEVSNLFDVSFVIQKGLALTRYGEKYIIFMDEAQHNAEGLITKALKSGCTLVVCYDENQRISDSDCLSELHDLEKRDDFIAIDLKNSVRYNGSNVAESNIKKILDGIQITDTDDKFELKIHNNIQTFSESIVNRMKTSPNSTIAVMGLLCKDSSEYTFPTNKNSIFITRWNKGPNFETPESQWIKYIYAKDYLNKEEGKIWVGTWWAPGLDFDYIYVIGGGDVFYDSSGLHGNPKQANLNKTLYSIIYNLVDEKKYNELVVKQKDGKINNRTSVKNILKFLEDDKNIDIKKKFSVEYDKYIKNFYYIMLIRGKKGCEVLFLNNNPKV